MKYKQIIIGGTFDRLHKGHKTFLQEAFKRGQEVLIGLTSDTYILEQKKGEHIFPFVERKEELEAFLQKEGFLTRAHIVPIDSKYDQTQIREIDGTALLVSSETYESGLAINKEREKNGLAILPLLVVPLTLSETGEKISSTGIRLGLFDQDGNLTPKLVEKPITISNDFRNSLHKPFGTLFMKDLPTDIHPETLVTVGDVTTKRMLDGGIKPKLAVVDFKVERRNTDSNLSSLGFSGNEITIDIENPAGAIAPDVWHVLAAVIKDMQKNASSIVIVDGEEDLLVIPLILLLPIGYTILYGQPGEGVVEVTVSEDSKKQLLELLSQYL